MKIDDFEFHDSTCEWVRVGMSGDVAIRLSSLLAEITRQNRDREVVEFVGELAIRGVSDIHLSGELPESGEIISAEFVSARAHESHFRWLVDGDEISSCSFVFASGAELHMKGTSVSLQLIGEETFVQSLE